MNCFSILLTWLAFLCGQFASAQSDLGKSRILPESRKSVGEEVKPSLGAMIGIPIQGSRIGTSGSIEYGWQPQIPLSAAVELGVSVTEQRDNQMLTRIRFFAKANYNFSGSSPFFRYTYVGLAFGPILDNQGDRGSVVLGIAPQLGFDIQVSRWSDSHVSLGGNANYLVTGGDKAAALAINAVAKYWF